jgi:hypothetical protein
LTPDEEATLAKLLGEPHSPAPGDRQTDEDES